MFSLLRELVARDLKVRYRRPVFGVLWALFMPFFSAGVLYQVFSRVLNVTTPEAPFFLYLATGVFSWRFFSEALSAGVPSLLDGKQFLRESRVSGLAVPLSVVCTQAAVFVPALAVVLAVSWWTQGVSLWTLLLPLAFALQVMFTAALTLLCSLLYLRWRDTRFCVEAGLFVVFYLTPVFYSLSLPRQILSAKLYALYLANPAAGLLNLYRMALVRGYPAFLQAEQGMALTWLSAVCGTIAIAAVSAAVYYTWKDTINDYLSF